MGVSESDPPYVVRLNLEKTHESVQEIYRRLSTSTAQLTILLLIATIVAVGQADGDELDVPFVGLKLEKWDAVHALVVLSAATAYRVVALTRYAQALDSKFLSLLRAANVAGSRWALQHPSLFSFSIILLSDRLNRRQQVSGLLIAIGRLGVTLIVAPCILVFSGVNGQFSISWYVTVGLVAGLSALTWSLFFSFPDADRFGAVVDLLDEEFAIRKDDSSGT